MLINLEKKILNLLLRAFYIFPIKNNRIIFNSMMWSQYSCNPKYISESLLDTNKYEIIWAFYDVNKFSYLKEKGYKLCKTRTLKYYYYRLTAKVSICNATMGSEIPHRKKQLWINTWHGGGGGYKKINYEGTMTYWPRKEMEITDLFCASSVTSYTNTVVGAFHHIGSYIKGTPRNDMFITNNDSYYEDVRSFFKINNNTKICLYAPTYRDGKDVRHFSKNFDYGISYKTLHHALVERFGGEWMIVVRYHPRVKDYSIDKAEYIMDGTKYPDMQELMAGSDMLITDYSSSIWDFSFTYRPCILFCYDLDEYITLRGFNKPIQEWGFPIARNNEELEKEIKNWDALKHKRKMDEMHNINGSFEDGKATERVCSIIKEFCESV